MKGFVVGLLLLAVYFTVQHFLPGVATGFAALCVGCKCGDWGAALTRG